MEVVQEKFEECIRKSEKSTKKLSLTLNELGYQCERTREAFELFKSGWDCHHKAVKENIYHNSEDHD